MSLSKDLISQFVKATKDTTTVKKESTVYGTVVKYNEKTYVKIDGSDLLTPAETLSSVEEGERVSIMIKDHTATITGNYTAPSASSIKVDGMDADLKANTADIKNLVAKNAEIENLVATKATIEDLQAANAEIGTLKADYAEIENLVADKASIGDLKAVNADIKALKADKADIAHLEANYATIGSLNAVYADVTRLEADKANVTDLTATNAEIDNLKANKADIEFLEANYASIRQLDATNANVTNLQAETANINTALIDKANVSDLTATNAVVADLKAGKADVADLSAANAKIANLEANKADISVLEANYATIQQLDATNANVENLQTETANINTALIDKANVSDLNATNANITNLQATKADVTDLNAANANINTLTGNLADITTLVNGNLTSDNIQSMVITGDKFTVEDAFIKDAMIDSVNASKINTGVINTNNVSIQSNDGSMILQGNLQQFKDENGNVRIQIGKDTSGNFTFVLYDENGTGQLINQNGIQSSDAIADGLIVDAKVADNANIAGSKLDIDSVVTEVNNGSTNIKGTKIYLDDQNQTLNVAFNNMSTTVSGNTSTLESHTTSINTMNGEISQLISDTTITKQDGTTVSLKDAYNSTVDTVNSHTQTIGSLETNLNKVSTGQNKWLLEMFEKGDGIDAESPITIKDIMGKTLIKAILVEDSVTSNQSQFGNQYLGRATTYVYLDEDYNWETTATSDDGSTIYINGVAIATLGTCTPTAVTVPFKQGWNKITWVYNEGIGGDGWDFNPRLTILPQVKYMNAYQMTNVDEVGNTLDGDIKTVSSKQTALEQNLDGFKQTVSETYATNTSLTNVSNNLQNNYSTTSAMNSAIEQKANEITSSVSQTYATKESLTTVDNKFADYSTTSAMNSAIQQKANEITSSVSETYATKTSVTDLSNNLTNNYSTTSAMNSAIEQKANEITSSVSETYTTKAEFNNLDIGGRNLVKNSNFAKGSSYWGTVYPVSDTILHNGHKSLRISVGGSENWTWLGATQNILWDIKPNTTITISCWYYVEDKSTFDANFGLELKGKIGELDRVFIGLEVTPNQMENGVWKKIVATGTTDCHWDSLYIYPWVAKNGTVYVTDLKVELGNKATDWTPAPEDIDDSITAVDNKFVNYSTTTQMNSAINQKANEITSSVSETYATKTSVTDLNNNLVNNYSTTAAMNSVINQKSDAILSTVSSTYTTKADFNNLSIGGRNYYTKTSNMFILTGEGTITRDNSINGFVLTADSNGDVLCRIVCIWEGYKYYTVSGYFKADTQCNMHMDVCDYDMGTKSVPTTYTKISGTAYVDRATDDIYNFVDIECQGIGAGNKVYIKDFKVEEGQKATTWSPAPEDIDSAISTVDNKFVNYSTTQQMNSAIDQKANEINLSVSNTYATKTSVTDLSNNLSNNYSTTQQMNSAIDIAKSGIKLEVSNNYASKHEIAHYFEGENRWKLDLYSLGTMSASAYATKELMIQHNCQYIRSEFVHHPSYQANFDDNYVGYATTYMHFTEAYQWTGQVATDDNGSVYLNDEFVLSTPSCQKVDITLNFRAGWNKIEVLYAEGTGGDGWQFFPEIIVVDGGMMNKMNCYGPSSTEEYLKANYSTIQQMNSSIDQKANEIISSVSETYATKTSVTDLSNNLTNNYSTTTAMNSAIDQKSDAILSTVSSNYATKNDLSTVDGKFANYSTTSAMNSAINQKGDSILSTVNNTYTTKAEFNNLEIGGTNLVLNSSFANNADRWATNMVTWSDITIIDESTSPTGKAMKITVNSTAGGYGIWQHVRPRKTGNYTLSFYAKADTDNYNIDAGQEGSVIKDFVLTTNWTKYTHTYNKDNLNSNAIIFYTRENASNGAFYIHSVKLEYGNKATDWTPAPEDINASITAVDNKFVNYSTTTQMNSAIDQKANEINLNVSNTYATKTSVNDLNNNLINNYSTTQQMNSAIDIAKSGIKLDVSQNYASKHEVAHYFEGENKWKLDVYSLGSMSASAYPTKETMIQNNCQYQRSYLVEHPSYDGEHYGDNYVGYATTYMHFTADYQWNGRVVTDDNGNVYLNDVLVLSTPTCQWTNITLNFKAGWNKLEVLYAEGGGGDGWQFDSEIVVVPGGVMNKMNCYGQNSTEEYLKANYSTTQQMNTAINQKADSITQSVSNTYATKTSLKSANDNITSLTNRMKSAESKLTKDSLTTTIGNYYTTSSDVNGLITTKGYATTSQVSQTATDLTAKFSSSGGYNLLRNSVFTRDTSYWSTGSHLAIDTSRTFNGHNSLKITSTGATSNVWRGTKQNFVTNAPSGKTYTASLWYYVADKSTFNSNFTLEIKGKKTGASSEQGLASKIISASNLVQGAWTKISVTVTTSESWEYIFIFPWVQQNGTIWITELQVEEGPLATLWSPHPYETYDGITQINKDGIKVYHTNIDGENYTHMAPSGFYIKNKGVDIFKVDSAGLYVKGNGEFTGKITSTSGAIGGYTISDYIIKGTNVGMSSLSGHDYAFWAGASTGGSAPFRVGHEGSLTATQATITGDITASSGSIGGFAIRNGKLVGTASSGYVGLSGNGTDWAFWAGASGGGSAPFHVGHDGKLYATQANITGTITGSTINAGTINGATINSDSFIGDMLAIDGIISAKSLQVQDIDNAKYPEAVTADFNLYVSTSGNDDSEIENGATFATFDGLLEKLPKNLNGHEVRIEMSTNITENVDFKGFFGGKIRLYMKGHTLYGYVVSRMGSARINICSGYIGNATDESNGWGKIHPSKGYAVSAYTTTVASVDQGAIGLYNIDVYGADNYLSGSTTKLGVAGQDWGTAYLNGVSYYGCDIGARANAGGRIHDVLSYNVCKKYGFYATTGGYITLAGNEHSGGKSKNYHEADAGKVIVASGATFASGEASVPGGSAPVVPTTKTITIKSTYGDTYRSSVYKNWKKDGTVRQGDYGYGDCNGCWFFGDAFSDLEGKTISKVTIKITRQSGGSSSAVGLVVKSHGHSGRPSGAPTFRTTAGTLSLAPGKSGPLVITNSTILNEIKSGVVKGFGIQTTYDSSHYAVCSGSVTVKIEYQE